MDGTKAGREWAEKSADFRQLFDLEAFRESLSDEEWRRYFSDEEDPEDFVDEDQDPDDLVDYAKSQNSISPAAKRLGEELHLRNKTPRQFWEKVVGRGNEKKLTSSFVQAFAEGALEWFAQEYPKESGTSGEVVSQGEAGSGFCMEGDQTMNGVHGASYTGDPKSTVESLVAAEMEKGTPRDVAFRKVMKLHPQLREQFVAQSNRR